MQPHPTIPAPGPTNTHPCPVHPAHSKSFFGQRADAVLRQRRAAGHLRGVAALKGAVARCRHSMTKHSQTPARVFLFQHVVQFLCFLSAFVGMSTELTLQPGSGPGVLCQKGPTASGMVPSLLAGGVVQLQHSRPSGACCALIARHRRVLGRGLTRISRRSKRRLGRVFVGGSCTAL